MTRRLDPTPLVRPLARRRMDRLWRGDAVAAQRRILQRLIRRARDTRFGRAHDFAAIDDVADFQRAVPLRAYEDFWQNWWQPAFPVLEDVTWPGRIPFFAVTSGTTSGRTKYIPLTHATIKQNERAALDMLAAHLEAHPKSRLFGGRSFVLGGSTDLVEEAPGVWSGDLSGIVNTTAPRWMRPFTFPPEHLALISDWDEKLEAFVRAIGDRTITALSGVPSWVLLYFERLEQTYDAWPLAELELYIHGGVSFEPYGKRFAPYLERSGAVTREVYPASEGFVAFADRGPGEGLLVSFDTGLFFEFVPVADLASEAPRTHWLGDVEPEVEYAVALTGPSGLWRYLVGDTVRFVETCPPRLLITGRTAYMLSAFGEHLIQSELDEAIIGAVEDAGATVQEYVVGPVLPEDGLGHHVVLIEPGEAAALDADALAADIDARLCRLNDDYAVHRKDDVAMARPVVRLLPPGACAEWMRRQGKIGGQHKVPRVIADAARFADARAGLDAVARELAAADH